MLAITPMLTVGNNKVWGMGVSQKATKVGRIFGTPRRSGASVEKI
jgi:hypothetical protein